jgi:UDP-glucose 4-epimerase
VESDEKSKFKKTVLVTGGAGFVGSHLADKLASENSKVYVLDNLSTGRADNISSKTVEFVHGDIRNSELVDDLVKKSDIIFHLAEFIPETRNYGPGHVIKYSVENPLLDFDVSCNGSLVVLDKCRKYEKQIVFTSSAAVYGDAFSGSVNEDSPTLPSSPYGASKLCAETYMVLYSKLYKLPVTVLRFCNLYGPRQRKYLVYDILLKMMKDQKKLQILGTGLEERDFIYVDDAVNAMLLAAKNPKSDGVIFNVGTGVSTSTKRIVELILKIQGTQPELLFTQASWKGDIRKIGANIDKIRRLGFSPKFSLEDGLRATIDWFNTAPHSDRYVD